jgi:hypothetical protein
MRKMKSAQIGRLNKKHSQNKEALNTTVTRLIAMGASLEQLETWTREASDGSAPHLIEQKVIDIKTVWARNHNWPFPDP